jgi:hypothetical protein
VKKPKARLDAWADAQKRFQGLNPKKFGGLANHRQEPLRHDSQISIPD